MSAIPAFVPRSSPLVGPTSNGEAGQVFTSDGAGGGDWEDPTGGGGGGIESVNGDTGPDVNLDAMDVGADPAGTADSAVSAHTAASDPHPQYTTAAELTTALSVYAPLAGKLSQFASTSSAELAGVISDETGSGSLVFGTSPTITTPIISGTLKVRQTGGTAGTNEAWVYHDGNALYFDNKQNNGIGHVYIRAAGGEYVSIQRSSGLLISPLGSNSRFLFEDTRCRMTSGITLGWHGQSNVTDANPDVGLKRGSAGVVKVTDGSSGDGSIGGIFQPVSMADASAPNNSVYYSTTASKLVYKDAGGVVNNLY